MLLLPGSGLWDPSSKLSCDVSVPTTKRLLLLRPDDDTCVMTTGYGRNRCSDWLNSPARQCFMKGHVLGLSSRPGTTFTGDGDSLCPARVAGGGGTVPFTPSWPLAVWQQKLMNPKVGGWAASACFSNGESPAGFFARVLAHRWEKITENSIQGSRSQTWYK